jgi:hypothetical protein
MILYDIISIIYIYIYNIDNKEQIQQQHIPIVCFSRLGALEICVSAKHMGHMGRLIYRRKNISTKGFDSVLWL